MEESKENRTVILREMDWNVIAIKKVMKFGCMKLEMMAGNLQKFCVQATQEFRELASFFCILSVSDWTLECCRFSYSLELGFSCLPVCDMAAYFGLCLDNARVV